MFADDDELLDLSRQCCRRDSLGADKPCTRHKPQPDAFTDVSYSDLPLCRVGPRASEAYRLVVRPSFSGEEVYCVTVYDGSGDLWWATSDGILHRNKLRSRPGLSKAFFAPLFAALEAVQFWNAPSVPTLVAGLDGHISTFEGIRGDQYRRITRWSPKGPFGDLEKAYTDLAGVKPSWR